MELEQISRNCGEGLDLPEAKVSAYFESSRAAKTASKLFLDGFP